MKKNRLWNFKSKLDGLFYRCLNILLHILFLIKSQARILKLNRAFKNRFKGESFYIVLNGPSVSEQDLSVLIGKKVVFVNRGYNHPLYSQIKPVFHVIIDPKLATGEWPIEMLDEIVALNPAVILVLNYKWYNLKQFEKVKSEREIIWINTDKNMTSGFSGAIDLTKPLPGFAVFGAALFSVIYCGAHTVYFTGFDANGLCHEMLKQSSHFYGVNEDNLKKTTKDYIIDLQMMSLNLNNLWLLSDYLKRQNIECINLTKGGLLDMFKRKDLVNDIK